MKINFLEVILNGEYRVTLDGTDRGGVLHFKKVNQHNLEDIRGKVG